MTPQEAITELLTDKLCLMAVASHPALVNVEEIGIAISALEKQIPKKPLPIRDVRSGRIVSFTCPCCFHEDLGNNEYRFKHCEECGQALDWSDTE